MVLPATEIAVRHQYRKLHKRSKLALVKSLASNGYQEEAKDLAQKAARLAAGRFQKKQQASDETRANRRRASATESTTSSVASAEVAVQRGSLIAQSEINEWSGINTAVERIENEDELAVLVEEETSTKTRKWSNRGKKLDYKKKDKVNPLRKNKRLNKSQASLKTKEITKEAWMCGCCGKVFSTFQAAESHEKECIQDAFGRLGYAVGTDAVEPLDDHTAKLNDEQLVQEAVPPEKLKPLSMGRSSSEPVSILRAPAISRNSRVTSDGHSSRGKPSKRAFRRNFADGDILLTSQMRKKIVVTDEALVSAVSIAAVQLLSRNEVDAETELGYLANSKDYYDTMVARASRLKTNPLLKFRTEGQDFASRVKNKFVDAYQLVKEGDVENRDLEDQYERTTRSGNNGPKTLAPSDETAYVNVVVKHSISVVNSELQRLANQRWEDHNQGEKPTDRFEQFRKFAHGNLVKLATIALASDFTPRKVAVQLSNDLYRLMVPQLRRRGVVIETEIQYRAGPYFVLAVNVKSIKWLKLMKYSYKTVTKARRNWRDEQARRNELHEETGAEDEEDKEKTNAKGLELVGSSLRKMRRLLNMTSAEIIAQLLAWLYWVHWCISLPICWIVFGVLCRTKMRNYILATVTDEIFSYVEEKGMEMEIQVQPSQRQGAFMLSALRGIREDSRELKKKREESEEEGTTVGPLLGPAIKFDKGPTPPIPDGFEVPENLEFVGLEVDLPVGFKRLRWAMLSKDSLFVKDAIFQEAKYDNITVNAWSKNEDAIGLPDLPDGMSEDDIVGAEMEASYLMPKSAFVKANMTYETSTITAYNDYCFCIRKRTLSPEVPYGSTFVAWTQLVFVNTGNDTCRMVCSTEAEFPNGPPLISRQIQSGMRAGTALLFVLIGETICKYAEVYP